MALTVFVLALCLQRGMADLICPETGQCTLLQKLQSLAGVLGPLSPNSERSPFSSKVLGRYVTKEIDHLKAEVRSALGLPKPQESLGNGGRQYYGSGVDYTTGYGSAYPGYGVHGFGTDSSTTFNGLDAALSALAFLAFGIWLFNLVLPQLQLAGLGVPGLGRRIGLEETQISRDKDVDFNLENMVSNIFTNSQELIDNIFNKNTFQHSKHFLLELFGNDFIKSTGKDIIYNTLKEWGDFIFKSGKTVVKAVQDILRISGDTKNTKQTQEVTENAPEDAFSTSTFRSSNNVKKDAFSTSTFRSYKNVGTPNSSPSTTPNPWMTHRWRRRTEFGGRWILDDLLGQMWKPLSYLAHLISQHQEHYQFPNSRTENVDENRLMEKKTNECRSTAKFPRRQKTRPPTKPLLTSLLIIE